MYEEEKIKEFVDKVEKTLHTTHYVQGSKLKVGVDLGTAYIVMVVLDEQDEPVACEMKFASVLRDGVVVDYLGALKIVRELKAKLEERLGVRLLNAAIAMPPGTEKSTKTHSYVVEGAEMEVTSVLDEPTAANNVLQIRDGVVVDIGGGTTGLSIFRDAKVVYVADEPTGGTHLSLVVAGSYKVTLEEAEKIKTDSKRHREILPIVKPVIEKMASIVNTHSKGHEIDTIYMCGGTCCLRGIEEVFEKYTRVKTIKPANPFLVTPIGIAMSCVPFKPEKLY